MFNLTVKRPGNGKKPALIDIHIAAMWAEQLDALAHPIRLTILANLLTGPRCVCEINDVLPLPEADLSHHLRVLEEGDLVVCRRGGMFACYFLSRPVLVVSLFDFLLSNGDGGPEERFRQTADEQGDASDALG